MRVPRPLGTPLHCSLPGATSPLTEPQIWNHPDVLYEALQKESLANEQDLDVEELGSAGTSARCPSQGTKGKAEDSALASAMGEATNSKFLQGVGFSPFQERGNNIVTYEWVSEVGASVVIPLLRRGVEGLRGERVAVHSALCCRGLCRKLERLPVSCHLGGREFDFW